MTQNPRRVSKRFAPSRQVSLRRLTGFLLVSAAGWMHLPVPLPAQLPGTDSGSIRALILGPDSLAPALGPGPNPWVVPATPAVSFLRSWPGAEFGFSTGGPLLLPERMDFWSGAFVGGMVAYHDPFRRYRSNDRRMGRTILGALVGGLTGQPISERDLLRYGFSRGSLPGTGTIPVWHHYPRPAIERTVPPRRR